VEEEGDFKLILSGPTTTSNEYEVTEQM